MPKIPWIERTIYNFEFVRFKNSLVEKKLKKKKNTTHSYNHHTLFYKKIFYAFIKN